MPSAIDQLHDSRLKAKLATLERVRADLDADGIPVPGVVAVGAQSAGKSSVMEYISGICFPRGENTCTRCPTVVSMECDPDCGAAYAFVHSESEVEKGTRVDDLGEIAEHIRRLTNEFTEGNKRIVPTSIHVKVVRATGPTLTMIDIPGLTYCDPANEDYNVHEVTEAMVRKYVKQENMVVLVVIPAMEDFSNAEALKIAKEYDREGKRTLGVVTKTDMVPSDDNIVKKLRGERENDLKLELGFVAVRCRSAKEVSAGMSYEDAQAEEERLWTRPPYDALEESYRGLNTLVGRIVDVQSKTVNAFVPKLKEEIKRKIREIESKLKGTRKMCVTPTERVCKLREVVQGLQHSFYEAMCALDDSDDPSLHVSARMYEYYQEFQKSVHGKLPDFFSVGMESNLEKNVREVRGGSLANFMSQPVFARTINGIFQAVGREASERLIDRAEEYLNDACSRFVEAHAGEDFPLLVDSLKEEVQSEVASRRDRVKSIVYDVWDAERWMFTLNHYYMDTINAIKKEVSKRAAEIRGSETSEASEGDRTAAIHGVPEEFLDRFAQGLVNGESNETLAVWDMQISLYAYAKVAEKRLYDVIPMLVHSEMNVALHRRLATLDRCFNDDRLDTLMLEDPVVARQRRRYEESLERLKRSYETVKPL